MAQGQKIDAVGGVGGRYTIPVEPVAYIATQRAQHITMPNNERNFAATGFRLAFGNNVGLGLFGEGATGMITGNYDADGNKIIRNEIAIG